MFILLPCFLFARGRSRRYETGDSKLDPSPAKAKSFKVLSFVPVIILALGLIVYLCILCRRKRMNRYLWTAAVVWGLYFASVVFLVVFTVLMAQAFRR